MEIDDDLYRESLETGLPPGSCPHCGGAHDMNEHATDGELAYDHRQSLIEPDEPNDWPDTDED